MKKLGVPETIGMLASDLLKYGESIDTVCSVVRQVYVAMNRHPQSPRPYRSQVASVIDMERKGFSRKAISNTLGLKQSTIRTYISEAKRLANKESAPTKDGAE